MAQSPSMCLIVRVYFSLHTINVSVIGWFTNNCLYNSTELNTA